MPGCSQDDQNVPPTPSAAQRELAPGCVLFQFVRGKLGAGQGALQTAVDRDAQCLRPRGHVLGICVAERCLMAGFTRFCQCFSLAVVYHCGLGWRKAGRSAWAWRSYWA